MMDLDLVGMPSVCEHEVIVQDIIVPPFLLVRNHLNSFS